MPEADLAQTLMPTITEIDSTTAPSTSTVVPTTPSAPPDPASSTPQPAEPTVTATTAPTATSPPQVLPTQPPATPVPTSTATPDPALVWPVANDFTLPAANGSAVTLSELTAKGPVVLVFYRAFW